MPGKVTNHFRLLKTVQVLALEVHVPENPWVLGKLGRSVPLLLGAKYVIKHELSNGTEKCLFLDL